MLDRQEVRIGQQVTQAQAVILNLASKEVAAVLCTTPLEDLRALVSSGRSLADVLPPDFAVQVLRRTPAFLRGTATNILRSMGDPAWDLLLLYLDSLASQAEATGDPGQIQSAEHLRRAIAIVGNTHARPWYRESMKQVRDRIVAALSGAAAGGAPAHDER